MIKWVDMQELISEEIKNIISSYNSQDKLFFKNNIIDLNKNNFIGINPDNSKSVTFIDGGQAEIINSGNFSLNFIKIAAVKFKDNKKEGFIKNEFYLLTYAKNHNNDLYYYSKIFTLNNNQKLIQENLLTISSNDKTIKEGINRAPIQKVTNMARRFAELNLAKQLSQQNYSDHILLDGTLEPSFNGEEEIIQSLPKNISSLAKSSSLFTEDGGNPNNIFSKIGPEEIWYYHITNNISFVKLHNKSKHVFRFEGNNEILKYLISQSQDPIFLGYPYGLIFVDRMARVTNQEKDSLRMSFLLNKKNKEIAEHLNSNNAHDILDNIF